MTDQLFAELLEKRFRELSRKSHFSMNRAEQAEWQAIQFHGHRKPPAVTHRIRLLAAKVAQHAGLKAACLNRFCKKYRQNLAELNALTQYGNSAAVWDIAYLCRKRAVSPLDSREALELETLQLFHDSPDVHRITRLTLKDKSGGLTLPESRELSRLMRNPYRDQGVPDDLIEMLWPLEEKQEENWRYSL